MGEGPASRGLVQPVEPIRELDGVQSVSSGTYVIHHSRPLEIAAQLLERKLGVPISYEEPVWSSSNDVAYASDLPWIENVRSRFPGWRGPLSPRGGRLEIRLPATFAELRAADPQPIIESVLIAHRREANPGIFKVIPFPGGGFSIVPDEVEDKQGRLIKSSSPLDTMISFPEEERSLKNTLELVAQWIGVQVVADYRDPEQPRLRLGASHEVARNVVARIFQQPGWTKRSIRLYYMPDTSSYLLAFQAVQAEVQSPQGMRLETQSWSSP